jgi:hypothetical protein
MPLFGQLNTALVGVSPPLEDRALACSVPVHQWEGQGATGWAAQAFGRIVAQNGEPFLSFLLFIWKFSFISNLNQI